MTTREDIDVPVIGPRSTPIEVLHAEARLRDRMDAAQPGLHVAVTRLHRDQTDFDVSYVPIPNPAIRAMHAAWDLSDDMDLIYAVHDAFGGLDGELTGLPHPTPSAIAGPDGPTEAHADLQRRRDAASEVRAALEYLVNVYAYQDRDQMSLGQANGWERASRALAATAPSAPHPAANVWWCMQCQKYGDHATLDHLPRASNAEYERGYQDCKDGKQRRPNGETQ